MTTNQILDDLRDTRQRLLAEAGGTIKAFGAALRKRQQESGRRIIETRRTIQCNGAATPGDATTENLSSPPADR